jgi:AraC-type DNA-binding domain-containing proteins
MEQVSLSCSCHTNKYLSREQFIDDHIVSYLISGTNIVNDSIKEYKRVEGCLTFFRKNRLSKITKVPPVNGEYKSISLKFKQSFLEDFSYEYGYITDGRISNDTLLELRLNVMLKNAMESLDFYFGQNENVVQDILTIKAKEILILLLKANPELKNVLFDFSQPGKIDLERFMNSNFFFNVSMEKFAYLTGRSLTSFKRDFKKIFNEAPGRWLTERRLQEAFYLINNTQQKPSDVYLKVGFEDLSHFSFVFKKQFGVTPSSLLK